VPSLSSDLHAIAQRVQLLETAATADRDDETVWRYYYGKGALDYRDKLIEAMGAIPREYTAVEAFQLLLATFPDPYPGKSS
jgi:hypothetical protein